MINFFKKKKEEKSEKNTTWIALNSIEQLDEILENSKSKIQIIFKHSTRCIISRTVLSSVENNYNLTSEEADFYYLDLLNFRETSNQIAIKFGVIHQSPQLIVVKGGKTIFDASHQEITEVDLKSFIG